jgi:hypothetical protein
MFDLSELSSQHTERLSAYANISRQWQYAVERLVFRSLSIGVDDIPVFEYLFQDVRRWSYLRSIKYTIFRPVLPRQLERTSSGFPWNQMCNLKLHSELKRLWNLLNAYWVRPEDM